MGLVLALVRHGKASVEGAADFDRPLADSGVSEARETGAWLAAVARPPQAILSSSAVRATMTATILGDVLHLDPATITYDRELYLAPPRGILAAVSRCATGVESLVLTGHNPGISEVVELLTGRSIGNMATANVALIELAVPTWAAIGAGTGTLLETGPR